PLPIFDRVVLGKPALTVHRVHELPIDRNVEGATFPRDELDGAEARTKLQHEGLREVERLWLITTLGAVRDLDLVRRHAATRVTRDRKSRMTSPLAKAVVSSRICASSSWSRARTS